MSKKQTVQVNDLVFNTSIIEIAGGENTINVPIDPRIDIGVITADDYDPMFVNIEIIRNQKSDNNRRYNLNAVREVCGLVPGVQGFLGHPDPNKKGFAFREPQSIYVGSMLQELGKGITRVVAKAYLFKNSKLREWVPKSIAAGNPLTVSVYGKGDGIKSVDGTLDIVHFSSLDSIDWANPGTQGMSTSKAMTVVSEMQDGENENNNNNNGDEGGVKVERNEIVQGVNISELKAFNPGLVDQVISGITLTELKQTNESLYNEIVESTKISEMKLTVDGTDKMVKLDDVQGLLDAKDVKISEMIEEGLELYKSQKIAEMVDEKYRDKIAKRVSGNNKTEIEASIRSEVEYISEMVGGGIDNPPRGNQENKGADKVTANDMISLFGGTVKEDK